MTEEHQEKTIDELTKESIKNVPEEYKEAAYDFCVLLFSVLEVNRPPSDRCGLKVDFSSGGADVEVLMPKEAPTTQEMLWYMITVKAIESLLNVCTTRTQPASTTETVQ